MTEYNFVPLVVLGCLIVAALFMLSVYYYDKATSEGGWIWKKQNKK